MLTPRLRAILVAVTASAGLAACTGIGPYGGTSVGVGYGNNYGYGSPYGYGSSYGYGSPYGYGYGSPYGYGYGNPYVNYYGGYPHYGWNGGYYYPGAGDWVYDRDRNRREMTPEERAFWRARFQERFGTREPSEKWDGFGTIFRNRQPSSTSATSTTLATGARTTADAQADQPSRRQLIEARRQARAERQQAQIDRQQTQADRQQTRSERQGLFRQQIRERREERDAARASDDD